MYDNTLKVIENNTERITRNVLAEIRTRKDARHYETVSAEAVSDRIAHVVGHVCTRLGKWLGKSEPKSLSFADYSDLGAARCKQSVPLGEVGGVLLMIRREIFAIIGSQAAAGDACTYDRPETGYYVNLLFVGIIQSIISGYLKELSNITSIERLSSRSPMHIRMCGM